MKGIFSKVFEDPLKQEEVIDLYRQGLTIEQLAERFKCSESPIRNLFKLKGIQARTGANKRGGRRWL